MVAPDKVKSIGQIEQLDIKTECKQMTYATFNIMFMICDTLEKRTKNNRLTTLDRIKCSFASKLSSIKTNMMIL